MGTEYIHIYRTNIYTHTYMYIRMYVRMCIHVYIYIYTYTVSIYTHIYTHTYICTYTFIYTYIYTHKHKIHRIVQINKTKQINLFRLHSNWFFFVGWMEKGLCWKYITLSCLFFYHYRNWYWHKHWGKKSHDTQP